MKALNNVWKGLLILVVLVGSITVIGAIHRQSSPLGAGYAPVTGYQSLTTARIGKTDTTIPVASVNDKAGNPINLASISSSSTVRMYFNLEPGTTREEPIYCTGISSSSFTGCVRGINFQGSDLTSSSTLEQIHNAGSPIIMTNLGVFYGNEFVSIAGTQTIFDVKTFNSFPVVTSTTAVPQTGNQLANKFYVDAVGAGGFTANNVTSTLGLQVITSGVPNCPSAAACVGINASSTASNNGGFLAFLPVTGILYWDRLSFIASNILFSGNVTSTGDFQVQNPVANLDAANKSYVDSAAATTGTAGMTVNPGDALYVSTTGTLFQTNSSVASSTYQFVGFSQGTYANGSIVTIISVGRNICTFSGLSAGYSYYLNGTNGQIATTGTTLFARVGRAVSSSCLSVLNPKFIKSGSTTVNGVGTTLVTTGFYPAYITITAVDNDDFQNGSGISFGNDSNMASFATTTVPGIVDIVGYGATSTSAWYVIRNNVIRGEGTVSSKSATGFTLNEKQHQATEAVVLQWTAWSE